MTQRISHAIDVFLRAIEQGTLAKGDCTACAVGNLVADSIGGVITREERLSRVDKVLGIITTFRCNLPNHNWAKLFFTAGKEQIKIYSFATGKIIYKNTGFTVEELAKIEYAFETNTQITAVNYSKHTKEEIRQDQIKGLEAVIQVMLDFDDCKELVQDVFTSKAQLIEV